MGSSGCVLFQTSINRSGEIVCAIVVPYLIFHAYQKDVWFVKEVWIQR